MTPHYFKQLMPAEQWRCERAAADFPSAAAWAWFVHTNRTHLEQRRALIPDGAGGAVDLDLIDQAAQDIRAANVAARLNPSKEVA